MMYELVDEFVEIVNEDTLTKSTFGSLQLLDAEGLNRIFSDEKFDFEFVESPDFLFHELVDDRIPDVIIDGSQTTLLIEAKRGGDTVPSQLEDEYEDLQNEYDTSNKYLLHVTDDDSKPYESIENVPDEDIIWMSWRELAEAIIEVRSSEDLTKVQYRVFGLAVESLKIDGYVPFGGFTTMNEDRELRAILSEAYQVRVRYTNEIEQLHKDVKHQIEGVEEWKFFGYGFKGSRGGRKSMPNELYRISPHYWFGYTPTEYEPPETATDTNKENYLFLDFNTTNGIVRAGYTMTTEPGQIDDDPHRNSLHENRGRVLEILDENNDLNGYTAHAHFGIIKKGEEDIEEFLDLIGESDYDYGSEGKRFLIAKEWLPEDVPTKLNENSRTDTGDFVEDIVSTIKKVNNLTYEQHPDIFYPRQS